MSIGGKYQGYSFSKGRISKNHVMWEYFQLDVRNRQVWFSPHWLDNEWPGK